jgi:hypothetical protein
MDEAFRLAARARGLEKAARLDRASKLPRTAAINSRFVRDVETIFREAYPLYAFTTSPDWNFRP